MRQAGDRGQVGMRQIAIIDAGIGNLRSVQKAFEHLGATPTVTDDPALVDRAPAGLPVPHMGWNQTEPRRPHPLLAGVPHGAFAYFAHSYHALASDDANVV